MSEGAKQTMEYLTCRLYIERETSSKHCRQIEWNEGKNEQELQRLSVGCLKGDDVCVGSSLEDACFALGVVGRMALRRDGDLDC